MSGTQRKLHVYLYLYAFIFTNCEYIFKGYQILIKRVILHYQKASFHFK